MPANLQFPFADVEPAFLVAHDPKRCNCPECVDTRELLAFLDQFEANADAFDDPFPWDPDWPTEADRDWFSAVSCDLPSAADLALEIAAIEADLAAWHERFNRDQFEAGMDRGWPEHAEAVEMRGKAADADPTMFL